MDKQIKLQLIGRASGSVRPFSPISKTTNLVLFRMLVNKFAKFENWPETKHISREVFEEQLKNNSELVNEYLDVYSTDGDFYLCTICHLGWLIKYYVLVSQKNVALLFFNKTILNERMIKLLSEI